METEKLISLLCGDQFMNTKALPEYDIPSLEMSDGPMGLRYQKKDKDSLGINRSEPATCLPAGVAVAASWNPDVAEQVGTIIDQRRLRTEWIWCLDRRLIWNGIPLRKKCGISFRGSASCRKTGRCLYPRRAVTAGRHMYQALCCK